MVVRLVLEWRRGSQDVFPGALLTVEDEVAAALIEEGVAVPASSGDLLAFEREVR